MSEVVPPLPYHRIPPHCYRTYITHLARLPGLPYITTRLPVQHCHTTFARCPPFTAPHLPLPVTAVNHMLLHIPAAFATLLPCPVGLHITTGFVPLCLRHLIYLVHYAFALPCSYTHTVSFACLLYCPYLCVFLAPLPLHPTPDWEDLQTPEIGQVH